MNDSYEVPTANLVELIRGSLVGKGAAEKVDPTTIRYALYVRKSTEDEGRQVQSIDD